MIKVLFFAKLRETLGTSDLDIDYAGTVAGLKAQLSTRNDCWAEQFAQENLLCAINQQVAADESPVSKGDEVAFFPPVTGG
ncbi:molybdopterin converting factor subunit 1 [uncultured Spongiibacter sp.]|nr:molybdopterin converting factor subunit 1 [uncultured Spongiibacter sp.]MBM7422686.1 molybdopterin synthase sulfur carrier subunit [Spongiibacter marinus]MEE2652042.1 molybdopterin converting factor subunit 1 [Pseudomonadota bacterium]